MKNNRLKTNQKRTDFLAPVVNELARIRIDNGIDQVQLAWRLGVTDYLVAKWECGIRTPSTFNLHCWADALNARLAVVANDNYPPPSIMMACNDNGELIANDN